MTTRRVRSLQRSRHPKTAESRNGRMLGAHGARAASTEPPSEDGGETPAVLLGHAQYHASTEPPSEDGGELGAAALQSLGALALQRSRHPKTAERCTGRTMKERTPMLQRSRHPKTAERRRP